LSPLQKTFYKQGKKLLSPFGTIPAVFQTRGRLGHGTLQQENDCVRRCSPCPNQAAKGRGYEAATLPGVREQKAAVGFSG
jgi:hypothetical protein